MVQSDDLGDYVTLVSVTITGIPDVSNCRNSSSLMSTSGCSSLEALAATWTLGMPVLLSAALKRITKISCNKALVKTTENMVVKSLSWKMEIYVRKTLNCSTKCSGL